MKKRKSKKVPKLFDVKIRLKDNYNHCPPRFGLSEGKGKPSLHKQLMSKKKNGKGYITGFMNKH